MTKLPPVKYASITMGCDPELFFESSGSAVGAEKVIPKGGMNIQNDDPRLGKIIIDGVQAELNPAPRTCRQGLASEIGASIKTLASHIQSKSSEGLSLNFKPTIQISKENLLALDEESRKFGCAPSKNAYSKRGNLLLKKIDSNEYLTRMAGGHIHLGCNGNPLIADVFQKRHETLVKMMDLILGNTCVLIDRDPSNIERRKLYGKAGEYRLPVHGFEYRTLSNFWLTAYPLVGFVFGMARYTLQLCADQYNHKDYVDAFLSRVKVKNVRDAINNNDYDLAMSNYKAIEQLIIDTTDKDGYEGSYPITKRTVKAFNFFLDKIKTDGLQHWFPDNPVAHWQSNPVYNKGGIETMLLRMKT